MLIEVKLGSIRFIPVFTKLVNLLNLLFNFQNTPGKLKVF